MTGDPGWPPCVPPQCPVCNRPGLWNQEPGSNEHVRYFAWRCPNCDVPIPVNVAVL